MATQPIQSDALIIGAGPVGLYQVFQLGLQGLSAHVVDSLPNSGGQCSALYPDKNIYDIAGIVKITGQSLTDQLLAQIAPFKTGFHFGQCVESVQKIEDFVPLRATTPGFSVQTSKGLCFHARALIIAAGVGAFVHKELALPALKPFRGYAENSTNASKELPQVLSAWPHGLLESENKQVVIYGGNEAAIDTAISLARQLVAQRASAPAKHIHASQQGSVTLVFRREMPDFNAQQARDFAQCLNEGTLQYKAAQITGVRSAAHHSPQRTPPRNLDDYPLLNPHITGPQTGERLTHLELTDLQGNTQTVECDYLVECLGLSPKLGPIATWGLDMHKRALRVSTETFETSIPGIFAVGDINTYPGKRKLIMSGFHEATLAAFAVASKLKNLDSIPTEYTSSSVRIQRLLGY